MTKKLIDKDKAFEMYYTAGASRSIAKLYHTIIQRYSKTAPSLKTLKNWSKLDHWQDRVLLRDNAVREGVQEASTAVVVEAKIKELQQLDTAYSEIEAIKPLIVTALQSEQAKKITPETTQDLTSLYNAISRLDSTQVKIIETARKIRGESDNINLNHKGEVAITPLEKTLKKYGHIFKEESD